MGGRRAVGNGSAIRDEIRYRVTGFRSTVPTGLPLRVWCALPGDLWRQTFVDEGRQPTNEQNSDVRRLTSLSLVLGWAAALAAFASPEPGPAHDPGRWPSPDAPPPRAVPL